MRYVAFNLYNDSNDGAYELIQEIQDLARFLDCKVDLYISTDQRYLKEIYSKNNNIIPTRFERMPLDPPTIGNADADFAISEIMRISYGYWVNSIGISQALVRGAKYQSLFTGLISNIDLTGFSELVNRDLETNFLYVNGLPEHYPYYLLPSTGNLMSDPATGIKLSLMWKHLRHWDIHKYGWKFFNFRFENYEIRDDQFGAYLWYAWLNNQAIKLRPLPKDNPMLIHQRKNRLFNGAYESWRNTRLEKLVEILGKDWFKGKKILELATGHGHIGARLRDLGAQVTCTEGRLEHIDYLKQMYPDLKVIHLDQDKPWDLKDQFDLIIHWGVLYHLDNWEDDLKSALAHGGIIALETEVADSDDPTFEIKVDEVGYDQALNGKGTRPSAAKIEAKFKELGATAVRYDDESLNSQVHTYNWRVKETKTWTIGHRRFWVVRK